jgi:hypothetical protein
MIAELAAANAAIAVIKAAIANGKELSQLGSKVFDYFDNEAAIQEKLTKNGGASDSAEFNAMEQLRQQKEHLREAMVYAGRPGLWDDWVAFQAQAARRRREQKEAEARRIALRKKRAEQLVEYVAVGIATAIVFMLIVYGIILYMRHLR